MRIRLLFLVVSIGVSSAVVAGLGTAAASGKPRGTRVACTLSLPVVTPASSTRLGLARCGKPFGSGLQYEVDENGDGFGNGNGTILFQFISLDFRGLRRRRELMVIGRA